MVLILAAAGRGSRLGELTIDTPKPLVVEPIFRKPILAHIFERLEVEGALEHVILVGANGSEDIRKIAPISDDYAFHFTSPLPLKGNGGALAMPFI